jgi:hypothetical protein
LDVLMKSTCYKYANEPLSPLFKAVRLPTTSVPQSDRVIQKRWMKKVSQVSESEIRLGEFLFTGFLLLLVYKHQPCRLMSTPRIDVYLRVTWLLAASICFLCLWLEETFLLHSCFGDLIFLPKILVCLGATVPVLVFPVVVELPTTSALAECLVSALPLLSFVQDAFFLERLFGRRLRLLLTRYSNPAA